MFDLSQDDDDDEHVIYICIWEIIVWADIWHAPFMVGRINKGYIKM